MKRFACLRLAWIALGFFFAPTLALAAPTLSFTIPTTSYINSANVASLSVGGACSQANEPINIAISGHGSFSAVCSASLNWLVTNIDASSWADGSVSFVASFTNYPTVTASKAFTKDTTTPYVDILAPANGTVITANNQASLAVNGSCLTPNGKVQITLSDAGNAHSVSASTTCDTNNFNYGSTLNTTSLSDGTVYLSVSITSPSGNVGLASSSYLKSTVLPTVSIVSNQTAINISNAAALSFRGTCNGVGAVSLAIISGATTLNTLQVTCSSNAWQIANISVADATFPNGDLTFQAKFLNITTRVWSNPAQVILKKITVPVQVAISSPTTGFKMNLGSTSSIAVAGTCSAIGQPVSIGYIDNVGAFKVLSSPTCASGATFSASGVNFAAVPDGVVTMSVQQSDAVGNMGRQDISFSKKLTAPRITLVSNASGGKVNIANAATIVFSGTCSEFGTLGQPVSITSSPALPGQPLSAVCSSSGTWSLTASLTALADGALSVVAKTSDFAGNSVSATLSLQKATVQPTLAITNPALASGAHFLLNATNSAAPITIGGTCSQSGVPSLLKASTNFNDASWAKSNITMKPLPSLDQGLSAVQLVASTANTNHDLRQFFTGTGNTTYTYSIYAKADGLNWLHLQIWETGVGGIEGWFDLVNGVVGKTSASPGRALPQIDMQAVGGGWYRLMLSGIPSSNATPNLSVIARLSNANGDNLIAGDGVGGVDLWAPRLETVSLSQAKTPVLAISASGVALGNVNCSGGFWSMPLNFATIADGKSLTENFSIADSFGNSATQSLVFDKKTTLPAITITSSAAGGKVNIANAATLTFSGQCSEFGTLGQPVYITASQALPNQPLKAICQTNGTWSLTASLTAVTDGALVVKATTSDYVGNSSNATLSLVKDTVAPTLSITNPAIVAPARFLLNANRSKSPVTFSGRCNKEGATIAATGITTASATCTTGAWTTALDFSLVPDGKALVENFTITDSAGNVATQSMSIDKKTTMPVITIASPANGSYINVGNAATFTANGTCSEFGDLGQPVTIRIASTTAGLATGTILSAVCQSTGTWSLTQSMTALPDGPVYYQVLHPDYVSNLSAITYTYKKKTLAPTLSIASPLSTYIINIANKSNITFTGACSESGRAINMTGAMASSTTCNAGSWTISANASALPDGNVSFTFVEIDIAGNSAQQSISLLKDTVAPTLTIGLPGGGTVIPTISTSATLTGSCSESGQTVTITSSPSTTAMNGTANCSGGVWSLIVNPSSLAIGATLTETAQISDIAGNSSTQSVALTKTGNGLPLPPTVTLNSNDLTPATLSGNCQGSGTLTLSIEITGMGGRTILGAPSCSSNVWNLANVNLPAAALAGPYSLTATITDAYGQIGYGIIRKEGRRPLTIVTDKMWCAIQNGKVLCWGNSNQLGNGTYGPSSKAVEVSGITNAVALSNYDSQSACAVLANGQVQCWGVGTSGSVPVSIAGLNQVVMTEGNMSLLTDASVVSFDAKTSVRASIFANAVSIQTGQNRAVRCALLKNGQIGCVGVNYLGQLGNGTTTDSLTTPTMVSNISNAVSLSSGGDYGTFCAVTADGQVKCWGANFGPLPKTIAGINNAVSVAVYDYNGKGICAVTSDGKILCQGPNYEGQLGQGDQIDHPGVVQVQGLQGTAIGLVASAISLCALMSDGQAKCWGSGTNFLQGNFAPQLISGLGPSQGVATHIAISYDGHGCAVVSGGAVKCWGENSSRQLGNGNNIDSVSAVFAQNINGATQVAAGTGFSCALSSAGQVGCWGSNIYLPNLATPFGSTQVAAISANDNSIYALLPNGQILYRGYAGGTGNSYNSAPDGLVKFVDGTPIKNGVRVEAAGQSGCALLNGGTLECWDQWDHKPTLVPAFASSIVNFATTGSASDQTCVVLSSGQVWCTTNVPNMYTGSAVTGPWVQQPISNAVSVTVGDDDVVALTNLGTVQSWGSNPGSLGDGVTFSSTTPVTAKLTGMGTPIQVEAEGLDPCVLFSNGNVACWGSDLLLDVLTPAVPLNLANIKFFQ